MPIDPFVDVSADALAGVAGGARRVVHQQASHNPLSFLDAPYKSIVFNIAGNVGGKQLAQRLWGSNVDARDQARAQAAFKQYLVAGNKLPAGVPNLFG